MSDVKFPEFTDGALTNLRLLESILRAEGASVLDTSPYEERDKAWFVSLFVNQGGGTATKSGVAMDPAAMLVELNELYTGLSKTTLTGKDKLANERLRLTALKDITDMMERQDHMRQIGEFQAVVLEVMESVLTEGQQTEILARLRDLT